MIPHLEHTRSRWYFGWTARLSIVSDRRVFLTDDFPSITFLPIPAYCGSRIFRFIFHFPLLPSSYSSSPPFSSIYSSLLRSLCTPEAMADTCSIFDVLIASHLNPDVPRWYVAPEFKIALQGPQAGDLWAASPMPWAPGFDEVMVAMKPPSPAFFASLPRPRGGFWAVYAVLRRQDVAEPALHIGSSTCR